MSTRNLHKVPPEPGSYSAEFLARLDKLEADIEMVGLTMTAVCREAKVARATPDRWRKEIPLSVEIVTRLEAVVNKRMDAAKEQGLLPKS